MKTGVGGNGAFVLREILAKGKVNLGKWVQEAAGSGAFP
jgi:hypothetical protein